MQFDLNVDISRALMPWIIMAASTEYYLSGFPVLGTTVLCLAKKESGTLVVFSHRRLDERGIEPRTTPMLREYYTTKPFARRDLVVSQLNYGNMRATMQTSAPQHRA